MRVTRLIAKERPVHFELNHETRTLSGSNGNAYKLGGKEFMILKRLAETPSSRVSTTDLLDIAWPHSPDAELSYVARTISDLRQKLGDTEPTKRFIETADSGYVLVASCEHAEEESPPVRTVAGNANANGCRPEKRGVPLPNLHCFVIGFGFGRATSFVLVPDPRNAAILIGFVEAVGVEPEAIKGLKTALKGQEPKEATDLASRLQTIQVVAALARQRLTEGGRYWFDLGKVLHDLRYADHLPGLFAGQAQQVARLLTLMERLKIAKDSIVGTSLFEFIDAIRNSESDERLNQYLDTVPQLVADSLGFAG